MSDIAPRPSLAEQLYLVLHYDALDGALLRNGKVNGSESRALAAAKLVDLLDADLVAVSGTKAIVSAHDLPSENPVLERERVLLGAQTKPRTATWCLDNLGAIPPVVEGLVRLGLLVDERRPEAPLPPAGLAELARARAGIDSGDDAELAAVLYAGDVWKNVYSGRPRPENQSIAARLGALAVDVTRRGPTAHARRAALGALASVSGVTLA